MKPPKAATAEEDSGAGRLRLEYVEAGTLAENPGNWRRHSDEQLRTVKELLDDPSVGWAGACLFNERTGRLIDGHARKQVVDPKALVPVLIGNWEEAAEAKILATLDPVGAMAETDREAYQALIDGIEADGMWMRLLVDQTAREGVKDDGAENETEDDGPDHLPEMALHPFEQYDYLVLLFRSDQDFQRACEFFDVAQVKVTYPGGKRKVGLGRVIDGARAMDRIETETGGRP